MQTHIHARTGILVSRSHGFAGDQRTAFPTALAGNQIDHSVVVGVRQPASAFRLITVVGVALCIAHMHVESVSSSKGRSRLSA
jgi:hypothetical protein